MAASKAGHTTALEMRCTTEPNSPQRGSLPHTYAKVERSGNVMRHAVDQLGRRSDLKPSGRCCSLSQVDMLPTGAARHASTVDLERSFPIV